MSRSPLSLLQAAFALIVFLALGLPQTRAQDRVLMRGDAVVTGFSGIKPLDIPLPGGADPLDYFFIDLQGPAAQVTSLSAFGVGPQGQLAPAAVRRQVTAGDVGQVFAVTLDDGLGQPVPNIYLGATSAYGVQIVGPDTDGDGHPNRLKTGQPGAQFMAGQFGPAPAGNPGTIWRVDGASGAVSAFATLPSNSGPGVGDIVFDARTRQFFASDLDKGLIHRMSADGGVIDSFDHGVAGRPARGLPPLADSGQVMDITSAAFDSQNPATWGYTQNERMVWGMAMHDGRLYYAVAGGKQVWSIGLNSDGSFAGDARWELDASALPGDGPVTDMEFDNQGRMLLAQRGAPRGSYDYSVFAEPEKSSVVRYRRETPDDPATPGAWAPDADEYAIGMRPEHRRADGGIALGYAHDPLTGALQPGTCGTTLWSTGSRLRSSVNPDLLDDAASEADVHGLQANDASLVRPQNVPPTQSYFVDYDGLFGDAAKSGHAGDIAIWQPCDQQGFVFPGILPPGYYPPGDVPPGLPPEFPPPRDRWHSNLEISKRALGACFPWGGGWACRYAIRIRNTGPDGYFGPLLISDHLPATPAGALMGFSPTPPWSCWNIGPSSYRCWRPATWLAPGASRFLFAIAWVPNAYVAAGHCRLRNVASILWAPGGTQWNVNPADDTDGASAFIPAPNCVPPERRSNLRIDKRAGACVRTPAGFVCPYVVTVTNTGPDPYVDLVRVFDQPAAGTTATFFPAPPWNCGPSGAGYTCERPVAMLPGGAVSFQANVLVPPDRARELNCRIENRVHITHAPGGTPGNTFAGDDNASATAIIAGHCNAVAPAVHCPPGYEAKDGTCGLKPQPRPEPRACPAGTVGDWPNCRTVERQCPQGTTGKYPNCRTIEVQQCPRGTIGTWPNCRKVEVKQCPKGTIGTWPNCRTIEVKQCPKGTIGTWPNCRKIEVKRCPQGTIGTWPNCRKVEVKRCPQGTIGSWPNCRKVEVKRCPKGTIGTWPNCRKFVPPQTQPQPSQPPQVHRPQTRRLDPSLRQGNLGTSIKLQ
jgi:hypothetical protein